MLNLSVKTKLSPKDVLPRIEKYFIQEAGLTLVESVAHLHGKNGSAEIRVYGSFTQAGRSGRDMLLESAAHMQQGYGLTPIYYLYHFHTSNEETIAHLVVTVSANKPTEVNLQSEEVDHDVKVFAKRLPRA